MTNEEKLNKMSLEQKAELLMKLETGMTTLVPKYYACKWVNCTYCDKGLICYKEWLKKESEMEK